MHGTLCTWGFTMLLGMGSGLVVKYDAFMASARSKPTTTPGGLIMNGGNCNNSKAASSLPHIVPVHLKKVLFPLLPTPSPALWFSDPR